VSYRSARSASATASSWCFWARMSCSSSSACALERVARREMNACSCPSELSLRCALSSLDVTMRIMFKKLACRPLVGAVVLALLEPAGTRGECRSHETIDSTRATVPFGDALVLLVAAAEEEKGAIDDDDDGVVVAAVGVALVVAAAAATTGDREEEGIEVAVLVLRSGDDDAAALGLLMALARACNTQASASSQPKEPR